MKILIVGSDINSVILAQYIKLQNSEHDIYLTDKDAGSSKYYTALNIPDNDIASICDFVKYNQIEFTIVFSQLAIINGIADVFKKEGFPIFAPLSEAARITFFNSIAKKIMYKLKINTPKFGIFDRENLSVEYVRKTQLPVVIENDFTLFERKSEIYRTFSQAKLGLQKIFENNNEKIVIENYIDEKPLYIYYITDGYNALPMVSIERDSGKEYSVSYAMSEKISVKLASDILQQAIYPLLDDIAKYAGNYIGIIGLKIKISNGRYNVLEFYNDFQQYDLQTFISILNTDILSMLVDAANGCLAENNERVDLTGQYAYTVAVDKDKINTEALYDEDDFAITEDNNKIIITITASTLNFAKEKIYGFLENNCDINIYKEIINADNKKELAI